MRNFKKIMGVVLALCLMLSVASVTVFAAESYTAVGSFSDPQWKVDNNDYDLVLNESTGMYELKIDDVKAGTYEFKIAEDHAWDVSYGPEGTAEGEGTNATFTVEQDGSSVLFTFNPDDPKAVAEVIAPDNNDQNDGEENNDQNNEIVEENKDSEPKADVPKTGDASMVLGLALVLVSAAFVVAKKRASAK